MALTCADSLWARNAELEGRLAGLLSDPSSEGTVRRFRVLVEATLSVASDDIDSAMRTVEGALAESRPLTTGVWTTGEAWIYEAVEDREKSETGTE
jgi:hypothetical protein